MKKEDSQFILKSSRNEEVAKWIEGKLDDIADRVTRFRLRCYWPGENSDCLKPEDRNSFHIWLSTVIPDAEKFNPEFMKGALSLHDIKVVKQIDYIADSCVLLIEPVNGF